MKKWLKRFFYFLFSLFLVVNIICAFQAYHFTRFYDNVVYKNPAQMGFFEKTGAALFGMPIPKGKVVDSFHAPHTNITIHTNDGFQLKGWEAKQSPAKGTILLFHGHGGNKSGVIREAESFYALGWNTVLVDFRAHGESTGNECSVGYEEAKDVKAVYDYVKTGGENNIALWGISMGAATITKAINDYSDLTPWKVILEMPFGTMQQAVEGRVKLMGLPAEPAGAMLTFWGGTELGVWAFSNKPEEYAKKITVPVLLQWGRNDTRVTEFETNAIFENLPGKQKELVIYEKCSHESLCKKEHEKWVQNISAFLAK